MALVSPRDQYHRICLQTVQRWRGPLLTCWPVITEAAWLLQQTPSAFQILLTSISGGAVEILSVLPKEAAGIADVMTKYKTLRPQFADAMLVYLANREDIQTIFTLDRRDFAVYRSAHRRPFHLVPEL